MKTFLLPTVQIALFTFIILSGQLFAKNFVLFPIQLFGIYLIIASLFKSRLPKVLEKYITKPFQIGFFLVMFALIFDLFTEERLIVGVLFLATFFFTKAKRKRSKRK